MVNKERKEFVKQQRAKFKQNPTEFIKQEFIISTLQFWKKHPIKALYIFTSWVIIYYLAFGGIQAINNDMIYCDATIDQYDGKVMYTHNAFVQYYNQKAKELQKTTQVIPNFQIQNGIVKEQNITNITIETKTPQQKVKEFNEQYSMYCNYNLTRWNQEPIINRTKTTWYGFKKIILKQS